MTKKQIKEMARILGKRGGEKLKASMPADYYKTIIKKRWDAYRKRNGGGSKRKSKRNDTLGGEIGSGKREQANAS